MLDAQTSRPAGQLDVAARVWRVDDEGDDAPSGEPGRLDDELLLVGLRAVLEDHPGKGAVAGRADEVGGHAPLPFLRARIRNVPDLDRVVRTGHQNRADQEIRSTTTEAVPRAVAH